MKRERRTALLAKLPKVSALPTIEAPILEELKKHVNALNSALDDNKKGLASYAAFLPPRLVNACRDASLIPFFGSGLSIPAGIPSWNGLLERLGLEKDYVSDPHAEHDSLTQAELIAHALGSDALQQNIVNVTNEVKRPALGHYLLALLRLPLYITTNYDSLFEEAWKATWNTEPIVVTNDQDVIHHRLNCDTQFPLGNYREGFRPVVVKIHGDAVGPSPHLILTRSDYRRHYRSNPLLFELIKDLMSSSVVFFLGFSHRDPEVARLVDDMVHRFETKYYTGEPRPLFSLQFDMRQRTPEVFAARGIVALRPPTLLGALTSDAVRSASVAIEVIELLIATEDDSHAIIDLASQLKSVVDDLSQDVEDAMSLLAKAKPKVEAIIGNRPDLDSELSLLVQQLGTRAGQGVYVVFDTGEVAGQALPASLGTPDRKAKSFDSRPYFRQAKMFRKPFVSDVFESAFNKHASVAFCMPLGTDTHFAGLLFSVAQPGCWNTILKKRDETDPFDFIIVDANGIAIVPPLRALIAGDCAILPAGELLSGNQGFVYSDLHHASRRDSHISHVVRNIVPIGLDDDVHEISSDLRLYSIVAAVPGTRWKMALSKVVPAAVPRSGSNATSN